MAKKEASFEENLTKLETIVTELEKGDVNLDELIKKYSEGAELSKKCTDALKNARETMDLIINENGETEEFKELAGEPL